MNKNINVVKTFGTIKRIDRSKADEGIIRFDFKEDGLTFGTETIVAYKNICKGFNLLTDSFTYYFNQKHTRPYIHADTKIELTIGLPRSFVYEDDGRIRWEFTALEIRLADDPDGQDDWPDIYEIDEW